MRNDRPRKDHAYAAYGIGVESIGLHVSADDGEPRWSGTKRGSARFPDNISWKVIRGIRVMKRKIAIIIGRRDGLRGHLPLPMG